MRLIHGAFGAVLCLVTSASQIAAVEIDLVKLGTDLLSAEQWERINMEMFFLSYFEARLENCGFRPDFERRATTAVSACVNVNGGEKSVHMAAQKSTSSA